MNKRQTNALSESSERRMSSPPLSARAASTKEGTQHLSEQIAALEAELALYRQALENSRQDMQSFAYSVSHDLKAPLRAIEGFSKILLDDFANDLCPDAQRFLKHIVVNTETLGSQLEDLLRYYRAGKSIPATLKVDTEAICRSLIAELPSEDAQKISIKGGLPPVYGDSIQLREIFSLLLANALKFSRNSSQPGIAISGKTEPNGTRFSIRDNGVGFDPKHASKLFQVFQKLHAGNEFPGNGIGLAIVKRLVQAHGGCVEAEAIPQQGATFSFTLPDQPRLSDGPVEETERFRVT